jgi:anti-sigma factor RsiW
MKCEECTTSALEELLDGEPDELRAAEMNAHLAACETCALRYDELLDEQTIYASYERDVEVTPHLWAGVAARIAATENNVEAKPRGGASLFQKVRAWLSTALVAPRFSPVLTAALVLLAIGATATVMRYLNSQTATPAIVAGGQGATATPEKMNVVRPTPEATPGVVPGATDKRETALAANTPPARKDIEKTERRRGGAETQPAQVVPVNAERDQQLAAQNNEQQRRQRATARLVREAESKYVAAIKLLSEDVNRKRTRLDPQVAARFDETLATIDRSIAEARRTVLKHGNDPVAVQYMLSAYAKKVEVMREMAALD